VTRCPGVRPPARTLESRRAGTSPLAGARLPAALERLPSPLECPRSRPRSPSGTPAALEHSARRLKLLAVSPARRLKLLAVEPLLSCLERLPAARRAISIRRPTDGARALPVSFPGVRSRRPASQPSTATALAEAPRAASHRARRHPCPTHLKPPKPRLAARASMLPFVSPGLGSPPASSACSCQNFRCPWRPKKS
jgi:hypothetical protein